MEKNRTHCATVVLFPVTYTYSCSIGHLSHLGCWAALWKISETAKILLKYATFWCGVFIGKNLTLHSFLHCSIHTKKLLDIKVNLKKNWEEYFWINYKLCLTRSI